MPSADQLARLTYGCPLNAYTRSCPFGKFAGLSHPSRLRLFAEMKRSDLFGLFALALPCSCPLDPRNSGAESQEPL